jgi:glycosyltransferase involved in cell wall biosynthesis
MAEIQSIPSTKALPLNDAMKIVALPELSVKIAIGAKVSDCPEGKLVAFEGEELILHEEDLKIARKVADRVAAKLGRKMTPGRLATACTYASQFVVEEIFRPDLVRMIFYSTLSTASAFYRCATPMYALNFSQKIKASVATGRYGREIMEYDIVSFQIDQAPSTIQLAKKLKEMGKRVVYEIDDAFDMLEPWHPQYASWGREKVEQSYQMMELADLVTVSTPWLADHFKSHNANIKVVPNLIDLVGWPTAVHGDRRNSFRVVWAGSTSHKGDLEFVAPALETFAKLDKGIKVIFFGQKPDCIGIPPEQVEYHELVPFDRFPSKLASLDADVAIAPLVDCPFNRGKSNLRVLQYMACGWPVVASDIEPYSRTMKGDHGTIGGLLVEGETSQWVDALHFMLKRPDARKLLTKDSQGVAKQYDVRPWTQKLEKIFLEILS